MPDCSAVLRMRRDDAGSAADRVPRRRGRTAGPAAAAGARPGGCPRRPSSRPRRARERRFRKSTVSSARPNARVLRSRTSTITSCAGAGGPGSTATRSSSWRPTWTFRARIDQPCSVSRSATRASASSPSRCAAVRFLGRAPGWPSTAGSCQPPLTWRLRRSHRAYALRVHARALWSAAHEPSKDLALASLLSDV